jgi:predicted dehydrogenase
MTFRIGVIGAGAHGGRYARHAARDVPGMGLAAICRRSTEPGRALAAELGCRYHASPDDLLADPDVDGVVVATPPASHLPLARAVLLAGKPLLLEKPMTGTLAEARDLAWLDERSGTAPLMVGQALRWNPVLRKVAELWPRLGRVHMVRAAQRLAPTTLAWQRDRAETVGGSVLLTGVHLFDTVRWLTGAEFVTVDSRQRQVANPVVEDHFLARAELSDGCWASCEVSKFTASRCGWFEAVGERGQLLADYQADGGIVLRSGKTEEHFDISAAAPTLPPLLADWLAAVRAGAAPPVTVRDGLATLLVVDACYRSAAAGAPQAV